MDLGLLFFWFYKLRSTMASSKEGMRDCSGGLFNRIIKIYESLLSSCNGGEWDIYKILILIVVVQNVA
jgi:hypothetical protein